MTNKNPNKPKGTYPNKATQWKKGEERVKRAGKKGGSVKSPAKKYSARLRSLKERGKTNEQIALFVERLEDPSANIMHIQGLVDKFVESNPEDNHMIAALNTMISLHRAHYGDKKLTLNLNVDIAPDVELVTAHLKGLLK